MDRGHLARLLRTAGTLPAWATKGTVPRSAAGLSPYRINTIHPRHQNAGLQHPWGRGLPARMATTGSFQGLTDCSIGDCPKSARDCPHLLLRHRRVHPRRFLFSPWGRLLPVRIVIGDCPYLLFFGFSFLGFLASRFCGDLLPPPLLILAPALFSILSRNELLPYIFYLKNRKFLPVFRSRRVIRVRPR
jgi:hypothetical protein